MNRQEVFNKVVCHLRTQGARAINGSGACRYLADDGAKCAVGCLIPDGHPAQDFQGSFLTLIRYHPDLELILDIKSVEDRTFLQDLQTIHDICDIENWEHEFEMFASKYSLDIPSVG